MINEYDQKLGEMWQAASRDFAVKFLRRAVDSQMCLEDLAKVLDFEHVRGDLHTIRLRDVVGRPPVQEAEVQAPAAVRMPTSNEVASLLGPRRRNKARRDREQTARIEESIRNALQNKDNELATDEVAKFVCASAQGVETATVALVLKGMEKHGIVLGDRSRPRRWRLKTQGRRIPEPIVIRKAAVAVAGGPLAVAGAIAAAGAAALAPPPPPTPITAEPKADKPVALMTQAEVEAAADRLRERFFSTSKGWRKATQTAD